MLTVDLTAKGASNVPDSKTHMPAAAPKRHVLMIGTMNSSCRLNVSSNAFVVKEPLNSDADVTQNAVSTLLPKAVRPKPRRVMFRVPVAAKKRGASSRYLQRASSMTNPHVTFDDEVFINDLENFRMDLSQLPKSIAIKFKQTSPPPASTKRRKAKSRTKGSQQISPDIKEYIKARINSNDAFATALVLKHKKSSKRRKSRRRHSHSQPFLTRVLRDSKGKIRQGEKSQSDTNLMLEETQIRDQAQLTHLFRPSSSLSISPPSEKSMERHSRRRALLEVAKAVIEGRVQEKVIKTSGNRVNDGGKSPARSVEKIAALFEYRKRHSKAKSKKNKIASRSVQEQATSANTVLPVAVVGFTQDSKAKQNMSKVIMDQSIPGGTDYSSLVVGHGKQTAIKSTQKKAKRNSKQSTINQISVMNSQHDDVAERKNMQGYENEEISVLSLDSSNKKSKRRQILHQKKCDLPTLLKTSIIDHSQRNDPLKEKKKQVSFKKQSLVMNEGSCSQGKPGIPQISKLQEGYSYQKDRDQWSLNVPFRSNSQYVCETANASLVNLNTPHNKTRPKSVMTKNVKHIFTSDTAAKTKKILTSDSTGTPYGKMISKGRTTPDGKIVSKGRIAPESKLLQEDKLPLERKEQLKGRLTSKGKLTTKVGVTPLSTVTPEDLVTSKSPLNISQYLKRVYSASDAKNLTANQELTPKGILRARSATQSHKKDLIVAEIHRLSDMKNPHPGPITYVPASCYKMNRSTYNTFLRTFRKSPRRKSKRRTKGATGASAVKAQDESFNLPQTAEAPASTCTIGDTQRVKRVAETALDQSDVPETGEKSLRSCAGETGVPADINNSKDANENAEDNTGETNVKDSSLRLSTHRDSNKPAEATTGSETGLQSEDNLQREDKSAVDVTDNTVDSKPKEELEKRKKNKNKTPEPVKKKKLEKDVTKKRKLPPFYGWDEGKELAPHTMTELPKYIDIAAMWLQRAAKQREREEMFLSGNLCPEPRRPAAAEDVKVYLARHGIEGLFTNMTTSLLCETPKRPIEHMLELNQHVRKMNENLRDIAANFPAGGKFLPDDDGCSVTTVDVLSDTKVLMQRTPSIKEQEERFEPGAIRNSLSGVGSKSNIKQDAQAASISASSVDSAGMNTTVSIKNSSKSLSQLALRRQQSEVPNELVSPATAEDDDIASSNTGNLVQPSEKPFFSSDLPTQQSETLNKLDNTTTNEEENATDSEIAMSANKTSSQGVIQSKVSSGLVDLAMEEDDNKVVDNVENRTLPLNKTSENAIDQAVNEDNI